MKKKFNLKNLDCAGCAQKIEDAINKIEGVESATLNLLMQKLTIVAEREKMPEILKEAQKIADKIEPGTIIE